MSTYTKYVLLVEDDEDQGNLFIHIARKVYPKCQIFWVKSIKEARNYVKREGPFTDPTRSPIPHLIILDLYLGDGIDGLPFLKMLKGRQDRYCLVLTIALSGATAHDDIAFSYQYGVNAFMQKTGKNLPKFEKRIEYLLTYWLDMVVPPMAPTAPFIVKAVKKKEAAQGSLK